MSISKKKMRIKIAQDVLDSIDKLDISPGSFLEFPPRLKFKGYTKDSKKFANELKNSGECRVCALGACLISAVTLANKFDFGRSAESTAWTSRVQIRVSSLLDRLQEFFEIKQLALIENAFEKGHGFFCGTEREKAGVSREEQYKAADFAKYETPEERLRLIMENIIQNDGTFIP